MSNGMRTRLHSEHVRDLTGAEFERALDNGSLDNLFRDNELGELIIRLRSDLTDEDRPGVIEGALEIDAEMKEQGAQPWPNEDNVFRAVNWEARTMTFRFRQDTTSSGQVQVIAAFFAAFLIGARIVLFLLPFFGVAVAIFALLNPDFAARIIRWIAEVIGEVVGSAPPGVIILAVGLGLGALLIYRGLR